ncbi:LVIVD repeat-containing protein [Thermodesulfobacteriota bacterium]
MADQHGNRLENSRIAVNSATDWSPNPLTVVLPITDDTIYPSISGGYKDGYKVKIAPSRNGQPGDGQYLYRNDFVEISTITQSVEFQWICAEATVNFRDQYGNFSYGKIIGVIANYAASPFIATLPINTNQVYATLNGSDSNGYIFKSPEYIGETETIIVSEQTQTIDLVWSNPYAPSPDLPTTVVSTFAYYLLGENLDIPLTRQDGTPINPDEVATLYGDPDGFTIYDNGFDICSQEYADLRGWEKPLKPVYQDLSSDWPNPEVREGTLAIDPVSGRFALFAGNYPEATMMVEAGFAWTGFGVPGIGDIIVVGDYAYLPAGEGNFQVIDVSNKTNPKVIGHFGIGFNSWVQVKDSIAYLIHHEDILTVDISIPEAPDWLLDSNPAWKSPSGRPMQMQLLNNNYAAVTILNSAIEFSILDLSNPANITELSSLDLGETLGGQELFINGNRAYVGIYGRPIWFEPTEGGGVFAIDINDPVNPVILGAYHGEPEDDEYDTPYLIGHAGDIMIMATNWNQVQSKPAKLIVVDMTDPANPRRRGEYVFLDNQGLPEQNVFLKRAVCDGGYLYVTNSNYDYTQVGLNRASPPSHLYTFDISDPDNIVMVDDFNQTPAKYRHVSKNGQYLYINDYNYGIRIFDVNNPSKPVYVGGTVTAGEGHWLWANEEASYAYLAQSFGGSIFAIDITDDAHPQVVGKPYWDGEWLSYTNLMLGKEDILYLPQDYAVSIVDFQDINNPSKIGEVPGVPHPLGMALQGNYFYINYNSSDGNNIKNLGIFDISMPAHPLLVSETELTSISGYARLPIYIENGYAFVTNTNDNRLLTFNVSNPTAPILLADVLITGQTDDFQGWYAGNILVTKGYAYIIGKQNNEEGFHIIDVRDPSNPAYVSFNSTGGMPENFLFYNNYLVLGLYSSTHLYDISNPPTPILIESLHFGGWASI